MVNTQQDRCDCTGEGAEEIWQMLPGILIMRRDWIGGFVIIGVEGTEGGHVEDLHYYGGHG